MIAVIADDLTGAAELGGLGLRYHLTVEIVTKVDAATTADLLIVSADTRSVSEAEAVLKIEQITKELLALQPKLVYKKVDSVLRGHVVAELQAQMKIMNLDVALIVPANPYLERTIKDGKYYYKNEPIHHSSFSKDPEFPIHSFFITDMLRTKKVTVVKPKESLPSKGIAVGEVENNSDLETWAKQINANTLLAGAAGFFAAILNRMQMPVDSINKMDNQEPGQPMLFVSGTTFNNSRHAIKEIKANGGPVGFMPAMSSSIDVDNVCEVWSREVIELLSTKGKAIMAIEESYSNDHANAGELREMTACAVAMILQKTMIRELVVEGGSTAAAIIQKQDFTRIIPVQELSPGVIRMKVAGADDLHLTIKPGSYEWSEQIWKF